MGFLRNVLLGGAVAAVLIAYGAYDPYMPDGLKDSSPYIISGSYRLCKNLAHFSSYFGFEKNIIFSKSLDLLSSVVGANIEGISFVDTVFDVVPVRIYTPDNRNTKTLLPAVVYYHGGGFCIGSVHSHHGITMMLAKKLNVVLVSVDYRLAPRSPYPAAVDDSFAAAKYFLKNAVEFGADPKRIALMGDSAGGNLATVVSMKLRDTKFNAMPKLQVLIYPVTQLFNFDTPSFQYNAHGPFIRQDDSGSFASSYIFGTEDFSDLLTENRHLTSGAKNRVEKAEMNLDLLPDDDIKKHYKRPPAKSVDENIWKRHSKTFLDPYVSPLMADDLRGLPEAYISSCQYDLIRDSSFFYAHRLREAKVPVEHVNLHACYHGWLSGTAISAQAESDLDDIVSWIKQKL